MDASQNNQKLVVYIPRGSDVSSTTTGTNSRTPSRNHSLEGALTFLTDDPEMLVVSGLPVIRETSHPGSRSSHRSLYVCRDPKVLALKTTLETTREEIGRANRKQMRWGGFSQCTGIGAPYEQSYLLLDTILRELIDSLVLDPSSFHYVSNIDFFNRVLALSCEAMASKAYSRQNGFSDKKKGYEYFKTKLAAVKASCDAITEHCKVEKLDDFNQTATALRHFTWLLDLFRISDLDSELNLKDPLKRGVFDGLGLSAFIMNPYTALQLPVEAKPQGYRLFLVTRMSAYMTKSGVKVPTPEQQAEAEFSPENFAFINKMLSALNDDDSRSDFLASLGKRVEEIYHTYVTSARNSRLNLEHRDYTATDTAFEQYLDARGGATERSALKELLFQLGTSFKNVLEWVGKDALARWEKRVLEKHLEMVRLEESNLHVRSQLNQLGFGSSPDNRERTRTGSKDSR